MKKIIRHGRVIDPANKLDKKLDIMIENGKIKEISEEAKDDEAIYFDANNKIISPGFVDTNCNFYNKEIINDELKAAMAGGYTTLAITLDTKKTFDNKKIVKEVIEEELNNSPINIFAVGSITKDLLGEELSFMEELISAGVVAFSDKKAIKNTELLRTAFKQVGRFDKPFMVNCEDTFLASDAFVNEGFASAVTGLKGNPKIAETIMIYRDVLLAMENNISIHILNTTCNESIQAIEELKKKYNKLTAGVNQDYFSLTEEECLYFDTSTKVIPPLRGKNDVIAVKEGLKKGLIDIISSGNSPRPFDEKKEVFAEAAFGNSGLEFTLALVITELVKTGYLNISDAISKLTLNPSKLLAINKGTLGIGEDADIVVFDINKKWTVNERNLYTNHKFTPYINKELYGIVEKVIVNGKEVFNVQQK